MLVWWKCLKVNTPQQEDDANKEDIFVNWTKHCICGHYHLMNILTHLDTYAMPLLEEIFNDLQ
jgi:hypothetical protein